MDNLSNCPNCGFPLEPGDKFCRNCGKPFAERPEEAPPPEPPQPPYVPPTPPEQPPTAPVPPSPPPPPKYVAWEDRQRLGFFNALWETWKESVFYPDKFFAHAPFTGGMASPILYAILVGWFGSFFNIIYDLIVPNFGQEMFQRYFHDADFIMRANLFSGIIGIVMAPIIIVIMLFIISGIYHIIAMLFGWAKRDFEATLRAVAYGIGPAAFLIIPFCGSPISIVWGIVVTIIGFKHMQQTTSGKAAFTILLPLILCCCLILILAAIFSTAILALLGREF